MLWAFEISLNQIYLRDLLFEVMDKQADIDLMDNVQKKCVFQNCFNWRITDFSLNFKAAVIVARITRLYRGRNWKYLNKNDGKYFVSLLLLHWYVSRLREKNVCYETVLVRIHITFSQRFQNQYHKTHSCQRFYKRSDFASLWFR